VKQWLEEKEELIYQALAESNFYESMAEYFLDGGSIGTATVWCEEDVASGRILFSSEASRECYTRRGG
jgi:hypothetical protein